MRIGVTRARIARMADIWPLWNDGGGVRASKGPPAMQPHLIVTLKPLGRYTSCNLIFFMWSML